MAAPFRDGGGHCRFPGGLPEIPVLTDLTSCSLTLSFKACTAPPLRTRSIAHSAVAALYGRLEDEVLNSEESTMSVNRIVRRLAGCAAVIISAAPGVAAPAAHDAHPAAAATAKPASYGGEVSGDDGRERENDGRHEGGRSTARRSRHLDGHRIRRGKDGSHRHTSSAKW